MTNEQDKINAMTPEQIEAEFGDMCRQVSTRLQPLKRWTAKLTYADNNESYTTDFDEFDQLGGMVEQGPDWNTIDQIIITLNRPIWKVE
jgi:hypothetical protein